MKYADPEEALSLASQIMKEAVKALNQCSELTNPQDAEAAKAALEQFSKTTIEQAGTIALTKSEDGTLNVEE